MKKIILLNSIFILLGCGTPNEVKVLKAEVIKLNSEILRLKSVYKDVYKSWNDCEARPAPKNIVDAFDTDFALESAAHKIVTEHANKSNFAGGTYDYCLKLSGAKNLSVAPGYSIKVFEGLDYSFPMALVNACAITVNGGEF